MWIMRITRNKSKWLNSTKGSRSPRRGRGWNSDNAAKEGKSGRICPRLTIELSDQRAKALYFERNSFLARLVVCNIRKEWKKIRPSIKSDDKFRGTLDP